MLSRTSAVVMVALGIGTARVAAAAAAVSGTATHYGGNLAGGNCMLAEYALPAGMHGTAIAGAVWDGSARCGQCLRVTGPSGHVTVMVVDKCPECGRDQLDLFSSAFAAITTSDTGVAAVTWEVVACGIATGLSVRNKSGSSSDWFSMQAFNSDRTVAALDVSTDGGRTWHGTVRRDYNYFQRSGDGGFGVSSVTVRVTCSNGANVTLANVGVGSESKHTASGNC